MYDIIRGNLALVYNPFHSERRDVSSSETYLEWNDNDDEESGLLNYFFFSAMA